MRQCPYWNRIRWIAADPNCWASTQQQASGNPVSIFDLFWRNGVRNMIKGINNQEDTWIAMMRGHWATEDCTFRIFDRCYNQIREFETAIYVNQSERQLLTSAYNEKIQDKDNHSLDDCKYFMLSLPKSGQSETTYTDPGQVKRWAINQNNDHKTPPPTTNPSTTGTPPGLKARGYR